MSIADTIKRLVGSEETTVEVRTFRCRECGETFDSAKSEERVQCMGCLSNDVELAS